MKRLVLACVVGLSIDSRGVREDAHSVGDVGANIASEEQNENAAPRVRYALSGNSVLVTKGDGLGNELCAEPTSTRCVSMTKRV